MPDSGKEVVVALTDLMGARVLACLTIEDRVTGEKKLSQFHGVVTSVDPEKGIVLELKGERAGDSFTLPPDASAFSRAPAGEYRLRDSDEVIANPDFLAAWTIVGPAGA
jgi:hypothetical protein